MNADLGIPRTCVKAPRDDVRQEPGTGVTTRGSPQYERSVILPILLTATLAAPPVPVLSESRPTLGSLATVTVVDDGPVAPEVAIEVAFAIFERVDWSMNEWRPESPLAALNATTGAWVVIPGDLCDALRQALRGAEATGGRFDPTWAALSDLWRFDGDAARPPSDAAVAARCALVGWRGLELRQREGSGCEARLARPGMRVGLGGLAKGWALDTAARALRALGFRDFLLQAGGDLYAAGRRGGAPWRVAVRDPRAGPLDAVAALDVSDRAFSTTGDYEHAYQAGGSRYHHVIDPRTCRPAPASRAATILAGSAVDAEVLGKAVFIEGGEPGLALARRLGADALVMTADGALLTTPALDARLERAPDPPRR
jgi:FAD:protein FMN transferase